MVGVSLTLDGVELLAHRHGLEGYLARASTFGIPLLAPWANRLGAEHQVVGDVGWDVRPGDPDVHLDDFGQPIHGLSAGAREWVVEETAYDEGSARLRARLTVDDRLERFGAFPFPHDLVVEVRLEGATLRVGTTLVATGDVAVPVAFAGTVVRVPRRAARGVGARRPVQRPCRAGTDQDPHGEVVVDPVPHGPLRSTVLDDVYLGVPDGAVRVGARRGPRRVGDLRVRLRRGHRVRSGGDRDRLSSSR